MDDKTGHYELDKNIPVPLYYQLKQCIINNIQNGLLNVGDNIPTEIEFMAQLGISRPTIRQAMSELVAEGYLNRLKGKGTFVSIPKIDERFFQKLESFNYEMLQKGLQPNTKVLDLKVIPGITGINEKLEIKPQEDLIYLNRLRFANNEPIVYVETFLPYQYYKGLLEEDFVSNSLYSVLESKYGTKIFRASRKIEAINANNQESAILNIKKNQAVCLVKTIAFTEEDKPVEYSIARYRGDRNEFSIELNRK